MGSLRYPGYAIAYTVWGERKTTKILITDKLIHSLGDICPLADGVWDHYYYWNWGNLLLISMDWTEDCSCRVRFVELLRTNIIISSF